VGSLAVNNAPVFASTGTLYRLLVALKKCHQSLVGAAKFSHAHERNLMFDLNMTKLGHAVIEGAY